MARTKKINWEQAKADYVGTQEMSLKAVAEKYKVSILSDCCTTVDEMIHNIALHAVSTRVSLISLNEAI